LNETETETDEEEKRREEKRDVLGEKGESEKRKEVGDWRMRSKKRNEEYSRVIFAPPSLSNEYQLIDSPLSG